MTTHRRNRSRTVAGAAVTALVSCASVAVGTSGAEAATTGVALPAGFHASVFASGGKLTGPDDITQLNGHVYVGYQNGVGPNGDPSSTGNTTGTVVEYTLQGKQIATWTLTGKIDGLGTDPTRNRVIATVNEDSNSSVYTITEKWGEHGAEPGGYLKHYSFSQNPLPHGGGTDSVVVKNGVIYLSASNPSADANGTTFSGPALYKADFEGSTVVLTPVLSGDSTATDAVTGQKVTLNLSDPDSSELVPHNVARFGSQLLLDSQGDSELIFLSHSAQADQQATVLKLSTQVDDTAFVTDTHGTLFMVDNAKNEVIAVTGDFKSGEAFSAVPNDSTVIPGNLGSVNLTTGQVTAFGSGFGNPHGLLFIGHEGDEH